MSERRPSRSRLVDAAEARRLMPRRVDRRADQRAEQLHPCRQALHRQARHALAHQRTPAERGGDGREHRVGARVAAQSLEVAHEHRAGAARIAGRRASPGHAGRAARPSIEAPPLPASQQPIELEALVERVVQPGGREALDQLARNGSRALDAPRPDDGQRRRQHGIRCIARFACRLRRGKRRIAVQVEPGADGHADQLARRSRRQAP